MKKGSSCSWSRAVKDNASWSCELCGSKDRVNAHHIYPRCDYPELELETDNGVCLCHNCHLSAHGGSFWRKAGEAFGAYYCVNHSNISPADVERVQRELQLLGYKRGLSL